MAKALLNCVPALDHPHLKARFFCSVWVPADAVGKILNKRGACEQIHHDQHIIRISAPPQEAKFKSLWTEIHLVGDVTAVYKAYRTIATVVDCELDDCVADFPIHHKRLGAIVGHRGEVVRRISADTGVRIYIPGMITRDGAQNGAPNVHLEGDSEHVFLALAFILEAVYNIKPSLTADGIATVKQRQTTTPTVGSGNNHSQQQQQQHADSSKSSEQLQQQQSNGQKQTAKGRNSPTSAAAVTTATESDSTKGATHVKQEPSSSSETSVAVDTTPAQDTIVIPSDKVKLLLGGNARTAVLKDILRFSGATAVRKEARGSTGGTGKSDSKRSKKTDTDTNSTTAAAAVTAAVVADDSKEPSDSSPTADDNKEAADSTADADTETKTTVDDDKPTSQVEEPDTATNDSNARADSTTNSNSTTTAAAATTPLPPPVLLVVKGTATAVALAIEAICAILTDSTVRE
eukprot:9323-Heterococcus_DN1.PRE.1